MCVFWLRTPTKEKHGTKRERARRSCSCFVRVHHDDDERQCGGSLWTTFPLKDETLEVPFNATLFPSFQNASTQSDVRVLGFNTSLSAFLARVHPAMLSLLKTSSAIPETIRGADFSFLFYGHNNGSPTERRRRWAGRSWWVEFAALGPVKKLPMPVNVNEHEDFSLWSVAGGPHHECRRLVSSDRGAERGFVPSLRSRWCMWVWETVQRFAGRRARMKKAPVSQNGNRVRYTTEHVCVCVCNPSIR